VALVPLAAFNLIIFNRYLPLTEGWWETYGYLYNSGLRPYRDFDLAFSPLFPLVNAGLLKLFGDSFFALRLFGVAVFLAAVLLLQLLAERLFSPRTAAVAVLVSTFLAISGVQFIAKDYHSWQLGLVALALLLHVRLASTPLPARRALAETALLGATAALVFLLKQNVGALLVVAIGATLPLVARELRAGRLAAYAAGAALPIAALLPIVSLREWRLLLLGNDAKGSLSTVLLRFWEAENREALLTALALCAAWAVARWALAPPARWSGVWSDELAAVARRPWVRRVGYLALLVAVGASGHRLRGPVTRWLMPATLALLALVIWRVGRALWRREEVDPRWAALALPLLALAYANTTTAAFDYIAMHVPVALAIGLVLGAIEARAPLRHWAVAALALVVVVPEIFAAKLRQPYQWWGHHQGSVRAATEEPSYPQLRGMRVSPAQRDVLEAVRESVETYSRSRGDTLFFSLPIFYWLHGKVPPYRTVVQWFDVVSSAQMEADLRAMRAAPPRLVVALEPAEGAYAVHRWLKHAERLPQEDFRALMDGWVERGRFRLVRSIALPSWTRKMDLPITQTIVVQGERGVGRRLDAVADPEGASDVLVTGIEHGGACARPDGAIALERGDELVVHGPYARVRALSELLGVARGVPRDWNTINVYVREDALREADAAAAARRP
jgi:hypothetical protein